MSKGIRYVHKFQRRYLLDLFHQFLYQNTLHKTALYVRYNLRQRARRILSFVKRRKNYVRLRSKIFPRKKKKRISRSSIFSVSEKARPKGRKILTHGGLLLAFRKKIFTYYAQRVEIKHLRKLTYQVKAHKSFSKFLECRLDSLLIRVNFINTISEARLYLLRGKGLVAVPKNRKAYAFCKISSPNFFVPPYTPFTVPFSYLKLRLNFIKKILSINKFVAYPPSYLMVSYALFLAFLLRYPHLNEVRYPFGGHLSTVAGLVRYY